MKEIKINTPFIKLDQLLKFADVVQMGSEAKQMILDGDVRLNGDVVFQRGKKIYIGDVVEVKGIDSIKVLGE